MDYRGMRLKSLGQQRSSVRRKGSFNKVRLQFEEISKFVDSYKPNNRRNDGLQSNNDNKTSKADIKAKYDVINGSLEVISERDNTFGKNNSNQCSQEFDKSVQTLTQISPKINQHLNQPFLPTLRTRPQSLSQLSVVKSKINYFEAKNCDKNFDTKKCNSFQGIENKNYGNRECLNKSKQLNDTCVEERLELIDSELKYLQLDSIGNDPTTDPTDQLCHSHSFLRSNSQISTSSDFVSFDNDSDVVFRRPQLRALVNETARISPIPPVPRQRTSLNRVVNENYRKEVVLDKVTCQVVDTEDLSKTTFPLFPPIAESVRNSSISQDSGISELSLNNSFLWQTIKSNDKSDENNCETNLNENQFIINDEQIDEHIYEELGHFRTATPNEWIDIETEGKHKIQIEVIVNRKSHNIHKMNNNYRKSFRPKPSKRKSQRTVSLIKTVNEDNSASATEYEDIDDEDIVPTLPSVNTTDQPIEQRLSHIYEAIPRTYEPQESEIRSKLVKQLSHEVLDTIDSSIDYVPELPSVKRMDSKLNIYTSTPRRLPEIHTNCEMSSQMVNRITKKDSIMSRNSSIYICPDYSPTHFTNRGLNPQNILNSDSIPFSQIRAEIMQNKSNTGSIASYLEFNTCAESEISTFKSEPLYQFYQKDVRRRAELWIHLDHKTSDLDYEEYENNSIYDSSANPGSNVTDSQMSADKIKAIINTTNISAMAFVSNGPIRSLWCHLPQVVNSNDNLLATLSDREKRLQESMFEIITSEASYCKSLNILVNHFNNCIDFCENNSQILNERERKCLFSNVIDISKISSNLLSDLEKRFEQNVLLYDVCDIVYDYAVNHFQPYIHYCAYQRDQEKLLTQLTQSRPQFVDVLQRLESNQICQNQPLLSFLMLPMQRITRYPLLIDAVCQQLQENNPILDSSRKTLGVVNQLVRKCNEETKKVQRMQELIEIEKSLHFRSKMKSYPIVSGARYLVKRGSVVRLSPQISAKRTIGKSTLKWTKSSMHLFLFSDVLILAKKKSESNYSVFDYCSRSTVQMISLSNSGEGIGIGTVGSFRMAIPRNHQNLAQLILLHNHESKTVEYTISFQLESDKLRWTEAVSQPSSENPNEVIYEEWDCPQVQCIKSYCAQQTDEISLEETDVLNVYRKMKDGWFEGQRIRDGIKGWFPSDYTEEIVNQHVRARNIRLRHRLLMYTQSVIEDQKRMSIDLSQK